MASPVRAAAKAVLLANKVAFAVFINAALFMKVAVASAPAAAAGAAAPVPPAVLPVGMCVVRAGIQAARLTVG
jgi:hypothetical protein